MADRPALPTRSCWGVARLLLTLLVVCAAPALGQGFGGKSAKMSRPRAEELQILPLRSQVNDFVPDPMRRATPWPVPYLGEDATDEEKAAVPEGAGEVVPGRIGAGPWKLFEGTFDESGCRAPRLSQDGSTVLGLCAGLDVSRPENEHVVIARRGEVLRYRAAVAPLPGGVAIDLSPDGHRFAVVVDEASGGRSVHLVDLDAKTDTRLSGGWTNPGNAVVSAEANAVAFEAQVGPDQAVVVVNLDDGTAAVVERAPNKPKVYGLDRRGRRVLFTASVHRSDLLKLVDVLPPGKKETEPRGKSMFVSSVEVDVTGAWMDPDIESVFLSAEIGGLCALYWANATSRNRNELFSTLSGCLRVIGMDHDGVNVLYAETRAGKDHRYKVFDRRESEGRYEVIEGCVDPFLSGDGRLLAVRCPTARSGGGVYLFPIPEKPRE